MVNLMDPSVVNDMIRVTPGAVAVSFGGVDGWGHDAYVPELAGNDEGVLGAVASVVVADCYFPDIGLSYGAGKASGINEDFVVGDYAWTIRGIEPGEDPGEIRLLLSNRRTSG